MKPGFADVKKGDRFCFVNYPDDGPQIICERKLHHYARFRWLPGCSGTEWAGTSLVIRDAEWDSPKVRWELYQEAAK